ncbi:hypothetical protein C8A01DRAFT_14426 [Parachaetomium inaequale]|uniref:Uncharacterized protein n=1 Tax=Parachaetomium inaequale TaxID=2588326 RepID=A0AAN6STF8_9PEZI|nr:hypothetical protein C8A01DRAFT_14426 [Parachaetomium inaequale]
MVPKGVQLSQAITPISIKPDKIFIALDESGNMTITGDIRNTTAWHPHSPSFEWWNFTTTVTTSQGLSSLTVEVIDGGSSSTIYSNGGNGFPLETDIIPQAQLSCGIVFMGRGYVLSLTVRDDFRLQNLKLTVPIPVQQTGSIVPRFEPYLLNMEKTGALEDAGYSLYTASLDVRPGNMYTTIMSYGLSGRGGLRDVDMLFVLWKGLGRCPYQ